MHKIGTNLFLFFLITFTLSAQKNLEFLGQQPFDANISDVWGYAADDGREYAIVGKQNGTAVVDVTDPTFPQELYVVPDGFSVWRDIKTHNGYAYIVDDAAGEGMLIIDMTNAPESFTHTYWYGWPNCNGAQQSHNIFIDEQGYAYLTGASCGFADPENNIFEGYSYGMLILDLNEEPLNPSVVSIYDNNPFETVDGTYVHDCFVRNDTAWLAQVYTGTMVVMDVSDKDNLQILGSTSTSSNFTHNLWLSDDGKTIFTTDEVSGAFIDAYDVSDLSDIKFLDKIQSSPGEGVIPHNTYVLGDFLITSYYTDGITIHDASRPDHLVKVGAYDTSPIYSGNGFNGAWGVYPYLPSGNILAADIQEGLYILKPTYQYASFLDVLVLNQDGMPISDVPIEILETGEGAESNLLGLAVIGSCLEGEVTVLVNGAEYTVATIASGGITEITITLESFDYEINVVDLAGSPVANPNVIVSNNNVLLDNTGDENGNVVVSNILQGGYDVAVGAWGYQASSISTFINGGAEAQTIYVTPGYYDDFSFDYEWTVSGDAVSGIWERAIPEGTQAQGLVFNPNVDVDTDSGNQCFVTGNSGGGSPVSDVVEGTTTLTSPSFDLSTYNDPYINVNTWFVGVTLDFNLSDDMLTLSLDNGIETVVLADIAPDFFAIGEWVDRTFQVSEYIQPTADMHFIVTTSNFDGDHLVEAGIDQFNIYDADPATYGFNGSVSDNANASFADATVSITNQDGEVFTATTDANGVFEIGDLPIGVYFIGTGVWGYENYSVSIPVSENTETVTIQLEEAYEDNFNYDLGWTVSGENTGATWELGTTQETMLDGTTYNPMADAPQDEGNSCYASGLSAGAGVFANDVDAGEITLTSPVFDVSDYINPRVSFQKWFATTGDDELVVSISNGTETVVVETVVNQNGWTVTDFAIQSLLEVTANMTLSFATNDEGDDHIVEAAIDNFVVYDTDATYNLNGSISDDASAAFADATVNITNEAGEVFTATTDGNGAFEINELAVGVYSIGTGVWGYENYLESISVSENTEAITIQLEEVYEDNFNTDLGWTVSGENTGATWELGTTQETMLDGVTYNPMADAPEDEGNSCYASGLSAGIGVYANDVDAGEITLTSPVFDVSAYANPRVSFQKWFANTGDDELVVSISNGTETVIVETVVNQSGWTVTDFAIQDFLEVTADMTLSFATDDKVDDHVVEAAIDNFFVYDTNATGIENLNIGVTISPNPVKDVLRIVVDDLNEMVEDRIVIVSDINGKELIRQSLDLSNTVDFSKVPRGMYIVSLEVAGEKIYTTKIVK